MPRSARKSRNVNKKPGFFSRARNGIGSFAGDKRRSISSFVRRKPFASFFVVLAILLVLIILNSLLTATPQTSETAVKLKSVSVYQIGSAPKVSFSGVVQKEGVVQIVAQTAGIVNSVNVYEGQEVWRGTVLVNLASNYVGGNAPGVQASIAGAQYKNIKDTYDTQKEIIEKQKELANQSHENAEELRNITGESLDETRGVVSLNDTIISTLEDNLEELEANNVGGANDTAILSTRQLLSQARSGNNQLSQALRNAEYQAGEDNPPSDISDLQRDIALKQLDVQEKALKLSKETSRLQYALASIMASAMAPASPFNGTVERVNVTPGQAVNPGTVLATVSSYDKSASIIVKVPQRIIDNISVLEESTLHINNKTYQVFPEYVSTEATDGLLYSIIYSVPDELAGKLTNKDYITVDIPVGHADALASIPYLPIDIIFQTQDGAYVYVVEGGKAVSRKIKLGDVVGGTVAVNGGLNDNDMIILDRNIIAGQEVKIEN